MGHAQIQQLLFASPATFDNSPWAAADRSAAERGLIRISAPYIFLLSDKGKSIAERDIPLRQQPPAHQSSQAFPHPLNPPTPVKPCSPQEQTQAEGKKIALREPDWRGHGRTLGKGDRASPPTVDSHLPKHQPTLHRPSLTSGLEKRIFLLLRVLETPTHKKTQAG